MNDEKMSDLQQKFGVNIPIPTIKLSDRHPCRGCICMQGIQMCFSVRFTNV